MTAPQLRCAPFRLLLILLTANANAEEIVYDGDTTMLRNIWTATSDDLEPTGAYWFVTNSQNGWCRSLTNNIITVNSGTINNISGAYYQISTSTANDAPPIGWSFSTAFSVDKFEHGVHGEQTQQFMVWRSILSMSALF